MKKHTQESRIRKLLYIIIFTLVFEGIARKLLPGFLGIVIFFLKDFFCLLGLYYIRKATLSQVSRKLIKLFMVLVYLIFPLLVYNTVIDPILLIWGAKTYLLYVVVAILMTMAFPYNSKIEFKKFINIMVLLILPTVLVAIVQINLPASHWLNKSVDGGSLEHFSAAGKLRVSSTFSFTGQFAFFLLFITAFFFANLFFEKKIKPTFYDNNILQIFLGLLLIIGTFLTGGRTAVLGLGVITLIGAALVLSKNPSSGLKKMIPMILVLLFVFPVIKVWKPEYFAVYEERSSGNKNDDVLVRTLEPFTSAIEQLSDKTPYEMLFGSGLGVMANGVQNISSYASSVRSEFWTETDFSTIVWEGGVYLIFIWYGFRLFIIFYCFKIWHSIKNKHYSNSAAFLVAYIVVIGLTGTLSIQPPLAIYFWISFGALICVQKFDAIGSR